MDDPFYLFMHIPKTAGTTLRSIVDEQYGARNVLTYYNQNSRQLLDNLDATLQVGRHDYKTLIGHFQYGVHSSLTRLAKYITFLRDPVARAISSYYENAKRMSPAVVDQDGELMTLEDCLSKREEFFANQQLKMIIGKGAMEPVKPRDLETARDNIYHDFIFTGITEYFDASILLLSRMIGWRPCTYGRLNAKPNTKRLSDSDFLQLQHINYFENRLYEEALSSLLSDMRDGGDVFDHALKELSESTTKTAVSEITEAQLLTSNNIKITSFLRDP